ncbi:hypothetical protein MAR_004955 [Mya arenaria]|uniref:Uncharacterized protein n=1 Tax=Mya arenaria TaxID=6604 RepID=A0ABY7EY90_MYAAR|nr:hypothetical protein MAR_004955 [Mya arenaria]
MLQELMLRIHQLETHVKVLQRASKEENPVVSLDVRGNLLSGVGVKVREGMTAHERPGYHSHIKV